MIIDGKMVSLEVYRTVAFFCLLVLSAFLFEGYLLII